jgi:hypothetical protein
MAAAAVLSILFLILIGRRITKSGPGTGTPAGRFTGWVSLTLVIVVILGLVNLPETLHVIGGFLGGIKTAASGLLNFLGRF